MIRIIILLVFITACIPSGKKEVTSGGNANPLAPSRWALGSFPKTLRLSNLFTGAEVTEITDAADSWSDFAGNGTHFFTIPAAKVNDRSNVADLDSLLDGVFAVYKATVWHPDLPEDALAVTQIFGVRHDTGKAGEYVEIVDADIIINYEYQYRPTIAGGYDLFTVVLHELGHFLGLNHSYAADSVMYPYIDLQDEYFNPGTHDISMIEAKYNLASLTPRLGATHQAASAKEEASDLYHAQGERGVRVVLELKKNGTCVHWMNGVRVESHKI